MDNFDHEENTPSGKGGSHDTILMLFQNTNTVLACKQEISKRPFDMKFTSLQFELDCQKLK